MERTIFNFWGSVIHCGKEAEGEGHFLLKGLEHELSHCCASTDRNLYFRIKTKVGLPNLPQPDACLILIHLPPRTGAEAYRLSQYETLDWRCLKLVHPNRTRVARFEAPARIMDNSGRVLRSVGLRSSPSEDKAAFA